METLIISFLTVLLKNVIKSLNNYYKESLYKTIVTQTTSEKKTFSYQWWDAIKYFLYSKNLL